MYNQPHFKVPTGGRETRGRVETTVPVLDRLDEREAHEQPWTQHQESSRESG